MNWIEKQWAEASFLEQTKVRKPHNIAREYDDTK